MSDAISLLKANYCRSIMRTASYGTDSEAKRLVSGLTTELATPNTTPQVAEAERNALMAIHALSEHLYGRGGTPHGLEWTRVVLAVDRWIAAAT